ncbi:MAG: tetratricopeptide repeat protein [Bacteroidetes bacterium]|nr:MAG: tetratricopeptide repeat protein [Bacteroidota bacterium]
MKRSFLIIIAIFSLGIFLAQCDFSSDKPSEVKAELTWRNHADSVKYMGMETCSSCHADIRHTFVHTGMGSSFGPANKEKAHYDWNGSVVIHDEESNLSYKPYFYGDQLMVLEFRLDGVDTVHKRIQKIDYIIGSGQHTNSHIYNVNGFLYQAPFTFYTQSEKADLPPGFEHGNNTRFSRQIGLECMSCHNAMPVDFVRGSNNKFNHVPMGIDCERCHGPGEIHVKEKLAGIRVDTSQGPDYSIVNPRRLDAKRQVEICQRCHLQGNAVLAEGKNFFDFKPGMVLSDVMDVYLPRYEDSDESFIMASHVDRFAQSQCVIHSEGTFNCISCHNPHISVRETNIDIFNARCATCHTTGGELQLCSEELPVRKEVADNCVSCHMPVSSSEDIPHVTVHDHKIAVPSTRTRERLEQTERVLQALVAINNPNPSVRSKARAFIQQYEQFSGAITLLDSAWKYVQKLPEGSSVSERVHIYYLRNTPALMVQYIESEGAQRVLDGLMSTTYDNRDAWTAYRIGQAYDELGQLEKARGFYAKATLLAPHVLEFENKFGAVALKMGDIQTAETSFKKIVEANPYLPEGHGNLGYVDLLYGDTATAVIQFETAIKLNPDYEPARLNLVSCYIAQKKYSDAKVVLKPLMEMYPNNERYQSVWKFLNQQGKN